MPRCRKRRTTRSGSGRPSESLPSHETGVRHEFYQVDEERYETKFADGYDTVDRKGYDEEARITPGNSEDL